VKQRAGKKKQKRIMICKNEQLNAKSVRSSYGNEKRSRGRARKTVSNIPITSESSKDPGERKEMK